MALTNVWVRTLADGLVRADQIVGVHAHRTPAGAGKPSHWLFDIVLAAGIGGSEGWAPEPLHRTVIQTSQEPAGAGEHLVRLLAQLDSTAAAGVITASVTNETAPTPATTAPTRPVDGEVANVRFRFTPFRGTETGQHYDPDYL